MTSRGLAGSGTNLVLASALAFLSYVPFEYVAKGSLIVCAILFIFDPIPPLSRLLALLSLLVVHFLSKLHRQALIVAADQQNDDEIITIVERQKQDQSSRNENNNSSDNIASEDTKESNKSKND